jgi:hypothetical protein
MEGVVCEELCTVMRLVVVFSWMLNHLKVFYNPIVV